MDLFILYAVGVIISLIMITILACYEKSTGKNIEDYPAAVIFLSVWSWVMVVVLIIVYRKSFKNIFTGKKV